MVKSGRYKYSRGRKITGGAFTRPRKKTWQPYREPSENYKKRKTKKSLTERRAERKQRRKEMNKK